MNECISESEVADLIERFGSPHRKRVRLEVQPAFFDPWEEKFQTRRGEVMFLLPRPGGVLLHRKTHYPPDAWRLLTGGIEPDETVEYALRREPREEIGFTPPIARFVALLTYEIVYAGRAIPFATYIFLMGYTERPLQPDDDEIAETRVVPLAALPEVAETLRTLPAGWRSWGQFRAYAHDVVAEQVRAEEIR